MTTNQMRIQISDVYHHPKWREKVARMSDGQVVAIFYRFLREHKFEQELKPIITEPNVEAVSEQVHQLTLFELGLPKERTFYYETREA